MFTLLLLPQQILANFSDVDSGTYYNSSTKWMNQQCVIQGYSDGTFKPDKCVNHAEAIKLMIREFDIPTTQTGA